MKDTRSGWILIMLLVSNSTFLFGQTFYLGADQSYVNEMEDCGERYFQDGLEKDVHQIFADHGCNLVRLRLWHTPSWYDQLNQGNRYSDLTDVKKSIARVKSLDMDVLLNFHLSDNWADPSKQVMPAAWLNVADDLAALSDSLYHYVYQTLSSLAEDDLLPEMVQIGNETNRGILLTPEQNMEWTLDWERNAKLFNSAIAAVRDVENQYGQIKIALHFAAPAEVEWYIEQSIANNIIDFDVIGLSYYWAWHQPTTIKETGQVIARLRQNYPEKEVLIVETGYPWTLENFDEAPNIINEIQPGYEPVSPENQLRWLVDLTQTAIDNGAMGVLYWEPSWVSTTCWNQWHQGSHQDHATFFDEQNNLIIPGGIQFMSHDYQNTTTIELIRGQEAQFLSYIEPGILGIDSIMAQQAVYIELIDAKGRTINRIEPVDRSTIEVGHLPSGVYVAILRNKEDEVFHQKLLLAK